MALDRNQISFSCPGVYRHSDGSWAFKIVLLYPSAVAGGVPDVVGTADVHVKNDVCAQGMAGAIQKVASDLPPDLSIVPGRLQQ